MISVQDVVFTITEPILHNISFAITESKFHDWLVKMVPENNPDSIVEWVFATIHRYN